MWHNTMYTRMLLRCIADCAYVTRQIELSLLHAAGADITNGIYHISASFGTWRKNCLKMAQ